MGKVLAEPAACIGLGALLHGLIPLGQGDKICLLISGGSVGPEQLQILDGVTI